MESINGLIKDRDTMESVEREYFYFCESVRDQTGRI